MVKLLLLGLIFVSSNLYAHEFTPTYPVFESSHVEGILQTKMRLFNKRQDAEYYEVGVFDAEWRPLPFGAKEKIVHVAYLESKFIDVFIRKVDLDKVVYICTYSKLISNKENQTLISSKICSKVK